MNRNRQRILLTGGHAATTGLAVIEEIKKRYPKAEISWVGSEYAISGSKTPTLEYKIYPSLGVKFYEINAGKLQTKFTRYTIPLILTIPVGFFQALFLIIKIKPKVILSFGGFSSFPVVIWGWVFGIPVILHEQTVVAGRASLASSRFARRIALARDSGYKFFPKGKSTITGNPLMASILSIAPPSRLHSPASILVVGGSRGSEFINEEIFKIIPELSKKYRIVHITGDRDFYKYKSSRTEKYKVVSSVDPREMGGYYQEADLIIARSGANTVSEIVYVKRPTIFIPLPRTYMNEQYKNAKYAEDFRIARVMEESEVNPESLTIAINEILKNWQSIVSKISKIKSPDVDASQNVVNLLSEYL